jgi:uncharacterized protein
MHDTAALAAHLRGLGRTLLGYSGGVDSALLAVVGARALGAERFLAVLGISPSLAGTQQRQAEDLAAKFSVPLLTVETREFEDPRYVANPTSRCYFCKTELWARLREVAAARGFDTIIDGTNADDEVEHRPGMAAGREHAVRSPLAELGWTKAMVREAARAAGLPIWDAPASPCLASRVQYGLAVTPARVRQVEAGEAWLRGLGVMGNLRVRHLGDTASIEVDREEFGVVDSRWDEIARAFRAFGFRSVVRDPGGYRRGGLLPVVAA